METTELRRLAAKFERAGHPDLARAARNRAATRELGIELTLNGAKGGSSLVASPLFSGKRGR